MAAKICFQWAKSEEQRQAVYRFRYEQYVVNQGLFMGEADHDYQLLCDDLDETGNTLMAMEGEKLVGTVRVNMGHETEFNCSDRHKYQFHRFLSVVSKEQITLATRLIVAPAYRGSSLCMQLNSIAFQRCIEQEQELVLVSCEPHLVCHYAAIGMRPYGRLNNHQTNGLLVNLALVLRDVFAIHQMAPGLVQYGLRPREGTATKQILAALRKDAAVMSSAHMDMALYKEEVGKLLDSSWDESLKTLLQDHGDVVLDRSQVFQCEYGHALIREGHVSHTLYVLIDGQLDVVESGRKVLEICKKGSLLGEVAFFTGERRMSDIIVGKKGATILALNVGRIKNVLKREDRLSSLFLQFAVTQLCHKLKERSFSMAPASSMAQA